MPERVLWLVDEYVMKSELPEGLKHLIERVITKRAEKKHAASFQVPTKLARAASVMKK